MQQYDEQIIRIKEKLKAAKEKDQEMKVFGAKHHKYQLNPPMTLSEVVDFESAFQITLPPCFKAFLLQVGNGGRPNGEEGAGPYYGIYPIRRRQQADSADGPSTFYTREPKIFPYMSDEEWDQLIAIMEPEDLSEEEYDEAREQVYGGILTIGSQGCSFYQGIILTGPHVGKVVYLDVDDSKPFVTHEDHFLDWYERWLDEIISGKLLKDGITGFGYHMTGSVAELLEKYRASRNRTFQEECLYGILSQASMDQDLFPVFEKEYQSSTFEHKKIWLRILTRNNYTFAKPHLIAACDHHLLAVLQSVLWHAKANSLEWLEVITQYMPSIKDRKTFDFALYLLKEMQMDFSALIIPMTEHEDEQICQRAFGELKIRDNKSDFIDTFIKGLNHSSDKVVYEILLGLHGVVDKRLLPAYKNVAARFPDDKENVILMLNHRLKDMGMTMEQLQAIDFEAKGVKKFISNCLSIFYKDKKHF